MTSESTRRQARRRLKQLGKNLTGAHDEWTDSDEDELVKQVNIKSVRIGDVVMPIHSPKNLELVPDHEGHLYDNSQEILRHFRWMMQKDKLSQDIFLIGPPGPLRRNLVMKYAEMTQREIEYVALSKDVTDADLKQRRELSGGTSFYVDQAAVRAAIHGRILVLDGIEKAERNVLPVLNNLLENREMALEDGRFLTTKDAIDDLQNGMEFIKVNDGFLVVALGLPVPPYAGYSLDPPLRSRFQCRDIKAPEFSDQVDHLLAITKTNHLAKPLLENLVSLSLALGLQGTKRSSSTRDINVPEFSVSLDGAAKLISLFPNIHPRFLIDLLYPYPLLPTCDFEQYEMIEATYRRIGIVGSAVIDVKAISKQTFSGYTLETLKQNEPPTTTIDTHKFIYTAIATFSHHSTSSPPIDRPLFCGSNKSRPTQFFVETPYHQELYTAMVIAHAGDQDICLVGTYKGVGKSALVRYFGHKLGYSIDYIPLYRDMPSRDLLQRRTTTQTGDTVWQNSLLVEAAIHGHLAVLDGIETLPYGTLNTLQRLVSDRETQLPDGSRLINSRRYKKLMQKGNLSIEELENNRLIPIHPAFRIITLARAVANDSSQHHETSSWLTTEILSMFQFIVVDSLPPAEEKNVLSRLSPGVDTAKLQQLLDFAGYLRCNADETIRMLSSTLSTRQLIRICRHLSYFPDDSLYKIIHKTSLSRFMPTMVRDALHEVMLANGIYPPKNDMNSIHVHIEMIPSRQNPEKVRIGDIEEPVNQGGNPMLIPSVVFHENPSHTEILMEMLKDYQLGDHLLLIGNQGVGKNKLTDYFLQLLQLPREYIQLHRDSTVQGLTTTPAIHEGVLFFEDSPLVKAVKNGTILVVDEADKAPTYVTAILKSLIEDGQMILGDGRRIVSNEADMQNDGQYILVHPNFRMIVLANRPGYPFLGNDFYREIGDVFSCHAVDNPDPKSEMLLLRKYGADVPEDLLWKLSAVFTDLRKLSDEGMMAYPYSTREIVNIVRHLQNYPTEGISKILQNVFDFDQYDHTSKALLIEIFEKHGIPIGLDAEYSIVLGDVIDIGEPVLTEKWTRMTENWQHTLKTEVEDIDFYNKKHLDVNKNNWRDLNRKESRTTVFSEQLYSFGLPTRGESLDLAVADDDTLFALTTLPLTLHRIDPQHRKVDSLDLHEYFPQHHIPPHLRLAVINGQQGKSKYTVVHNPSKNDLLCFDYFNMTLVSVIILGLEPVKSIMCNSLSSNGILVFYQNDLDTIAILNFAVMKQYTVKLPVRIKHLLVADTGLWIVHGSRDGNAYSLYCPENTCVPTAMGLVRVAGQNGHQMDQAINICRQHIGSDTSIRALHHASARRFGSIATGWSAEQFIHGIGVINIASYFDTSRANVKTMPSSVLGSALYLEHTQQLAVIQPSFNGRAESTLDLVNLNANQVWRIRLPLSVFGDEYDFYKAVGVSDVQSDRYVARMGELSNGNLVTIDTVGFIRVFQVNAKDLYEAAAAWKQLIGVDQNSLSIIYQTNNDQQTVELNQQTKEAANQRSDRGNNNNNTSNGQGSGGNQGRGKGEGGQDGDGQGDKGGGINGKGNRDNKNGRKEINFENLKNLKLKATGDVPDEISNAKREMHRSAMEKLLGKMEMDPAEYDAMYELRVVLEGVEAKNKERVWLKNQTIEGLTGERSIYKRRGDDDPEIGLFHDKPKRMNFVFDLSASMFRFNAHDRRLERSLEVALMLMESFRGLEHKFAYSISGHSGDSAYMEFVKPGYYPRSEKEEFEVLSRMRAHCRYCLSGDKTLDAVTHSIKEIVTEVGDDYLVVILSDANIAHYKIQPKDIAQALKSDSRVTAQMIFIGSIQDQAEQLKKALGSHAHMCIENKELPKIMKSLFLASMMK
ncbi:AAA domain-domain-containing protein [Absidia repens]|uniref:von Willebrand factor A domain-containing protein 8 n=1 Tax=Absidia repens TaxID=90262 RepID=A0A1X2IEF8_9FUNG|nr:AAA domain-domain-containing protein [Absidia repens]